ncbi:MULTISPECIES: CapA family protein [unclassified Streptococcus]|uniref:CapA family protein n=1 Tax=unclassified Streptococcus TaxID=2608887 RepID=UPI0010721F8B|nr:MULTISPECIES: CapA family protein [unclassified Streptococcus]MBF0805633.1 CapA family protein [Streptococcus sp. 19428wA2_WM07]TFU28870.1 CapA family protein [Streptococcus sp. WM07]
MKKEVFITGLLTAVTLAGVGVYFGRPYVQELVKNQEDSQVSQARIMAHGDLLYHDILYYSAEQTGGSYDFSENFTYVKSWLDQADLAIGDFEGTINPDYPLSGYPLFNAPPQVVQAIKGAGYDVMDLAHNHILDSGLEGVGTTVQAFKDAGIEPIGVYAEQARDQAPLLIKEVNGIKIALLAYAYGFNGLEAGLSPEEYESVLSDLDLEKMEAEIKRAEKEADITIVMPQMGEEYRLSPTDEQVAIYHKMVDWGADLVFGGHPHVPEPTETIEKDGENKFIIYSMGNFISNQRIESMDGMPNSEWTERGVLMDVEVEKKNQQTRIKTVKAHPTWVSRVEKGTYSQFGFPQYLYQTLIIEDFLKGGRYEGQLDFETQARIEEAYEATNELLAIHWP